MEPIGFFLSNKNKRLEAGPPHLPQERGVPPRCLLSLLKKWGGRSSYCCSHESEERNAPKGKESTELKPRELQRDANPPDEKFSPSWFIPFKSNSLILCPNFVLGFNPYQCFTL